MHPNLTERQKDLLRFLVQKHETCGGVAFILLRGNGSCGLIYPRSSQISVENDVLDFKQLRQEGLLSLIPGGAHQWNGQPTAVGIEMIRRGFRSRRLMRDIESRCPLLSASAKEHLQQRGEPVEIALSYRIELGASTIRQRKEAIRNAVGEQGQERAQALLNQEAAGLRQDIIQAAELVGTEGVKEFALGLLNTQNRLLVHADLVRGYTAALIGALRRWLNGSEVFRKEPLLPWRVDPIAQRAIQVCEEVLAERAALEPDQPFPARDSGDRTWAPLVQEWEALKATRQYTSIFEAPESIPEADLRALIAEQHTIKPSEVTDDYIELAALEFCRHYERFRIIPTAKGQSAPSPPNLAPSLDAEFWRAREDEFRARASEEDRCLGATHFSPEDRWSFHNGRGGPLPAKLVEAFKSIARDAAKGLGTLRNAESWIDWLNLLRDARDNDTGKLLFTKNCPGSSVMSERERDRLTAEGDAVSSGALIEFVLTADGGVGRRLYWDTNTAVIENVFENSALLCRKLRSLAPTQSRANSIALPEGGSADNGLINESTKGPGRSVPPKRKHGPTPDLDSAKLVAAVVDRKAPEGNWRPKWEEVCEALDAAEVPSPKKWRNFKPPYKCWADCVDRALAVKAIQYRLKLAQKHGQPLPGTSA